jgi:hypothetical protein
MGSKEAARRSCNCKRAQTRPGRTQAIVPHNEFDWAMKRLGWLLGIAFGVMFALGLIGG